MAVLERIIPLFLTVCATVKAQGEPPFGIVQPFPENIYPLEFTRANVTCIAFDATGKQEPKNITFYRRDDLNLYREVTGDDYLFSSKTEYVGVGKIKKLFTTMTWKNITREDDSQNSQLGSYECHAFAVDESVKAKRHGFSVSVITESEIPKVNVPDSILLDPGDNIKIFCNLTERGNEYSTPLKRISWYKDGRLLERVRNPDPDAEQQNDFLPPLELENVGFQDGGTYTCSLVVKLRNIKEYIVKDTTVIKIAPRLAKPKEDIEKVAFKGDDVSFECAAKGYPLEVEWKVKKKNEETVEACINESDGHYKIEQASMYDPYILTISKLEYSDRGFYYCCLPSNCSKNVEYKCQRFILRVRDRLGPLWPVIGIIVEALVLFLIIFIAEKRKKDKEKAEKVDGRMEFSYSSTDDGNGTRGQVRLRKAGETPVA